MGTLPRRPRGAAVSDRDPPRPEDILATYEAVAPEWPAARSTALFERETLDAFVALAPGRRMLDLGCGSGVPIARALTAMGCTVTGVDGAAAMVALFADNLPDARAVHADMRRLALGERFDGILAFDSFFHLSPDDQRAMFAVFAAHATPGAALLFNTGPAEGVAYGTVAGRPVYHASLAPDEYRDLLAAHGFAEVAFRPEDPGCGGRSVWLARRGG